VRDRCGRDNADGAYRYDRHTHTLFSVATGDIRSLTACRTFVATAPVNMVNGRPGPDERDPIADVKAFYSATVTGFIARTCTVLASAGLAAVVRGLGSRMPWRAMGLGRHQRLILAQSWASAGGAR